MIDFDRPESWEPSLSEVLREIVPSAVKEKVRSAKPRYVEDARNMVLRLAGHDKVIDAMLAWIRSSEVHGYHGTRLDDPDLDSIKRHGLIPLAAETRRTRLERALSVHRRWPEVRDRLAESLRAHGPGKRAGGRENQVHLTLSRSGLTNGFNHYLTHGSEFDQHVAHDLFGEEGNELLGQDGKPFLIDVLVPGASAIAAAHPYFTPDDVRANGDVPNIVKELLEAWSFRIPYPDHKTASLRVDCGMVFRESIPPSWIVSIEELTFDPATAQA